MEGINETLEQIGLTPGEIKVYTALLHLGNSKVGPIIQKSKISSSKVYVVLDKLIDKGLVDFIIKEKTKYFQISPPTALIEYVEEKEKKINESKNNLKLIIKKIDNIQTNLPFNEDARIYRGIKGLKTGLFEAIKTIKSGEDYLFFSTGYGSNEELQKVFEIMANELKSRKIKIKGLANSKEKELFSKKYKKMGYEMRFTDMGWPSDITISGDYLLIIVLDSDEPVLYAIKSKVLTQSYRSFFHSLW